MAYGAARIGSGKSLVGLFAALARAAQLRLGEFNAQDLANTAWAFATAVQLDEVLVGEGIGNASWRCQCTGPRQH